VSVMFSVRVVRAEQLDGQAFSSSARRRLTADLAIPRRSAAPVMLPAPPPRRSTHLFELIHCSRIRNSIFIIVQFMLFGATLRLCLMVAPITWLTTWLNRFRRYEMKAMNGRKPGSKVLSAAGRQQRPQ